MSPKKARKLDNASMRNFLSGAKDYSGDVMEKIKEVLESKKIDWEYGTSDDEICALAKPEKCNAIRDSVYTILDKEIPSSRAYLLVDVSPQPISKTICIRIKRK